MTHAIQMLRRIRNAFNDISKIEKEHYATTGCDCVYCLELLIESESYIKAKQDFIELINNIPY